MNNTTENKIEKLVKRMDNLEKSVDKRFEWYRDDLNRIFYGNDTERKLSKTEPGVLEKLDHLETIVDLLKKNLEKSGS